MSSNSTEQRYKYINVGLLGDKFNIQQLSDDILHVYKMGWMKCQTLFSGKK